MTIGQNQFLSNELRTTAGLNSELTSAKLCVPLRLPLCDSAFKKVTNLCKAVLSQQIIIVTDRGVGVVDPILYTAN
ncbi:MAG: hypothetical protein V7K67_04175 [Nostoc sp.]|uniref:hypothetical protein n=1 Tax=Nostoc sp. TaxID=1180 RepID=UPI002FF30476